MCLLGRAADGGIQDAGCRGRRGGWLAQGHPPGPGAELAGVQHGLLRPGFFREDPGGGLPVQARGGKRDRSSRDIVFGGGRRAGHSSKIADEAVEKALEKATGERQSRKAIEGE